MLDTVADTPRDRRPVIVICAYDSIEGGWTSLDGLSAATWAPAGTRAVPVPSAPPLELCTTLDAHLKSADCRALLLVGRARRGETFRMQMRAGNRSHDGGEKLSLTGPALARTTAPVAEIVRALNEAGLSAHAMSDGDEDIGSYLLYSLLIGQDATDDARAVGLLRVPIEADDQTLEKGVRIATEAIARQLSPLSRTH